MSKRRDKKGRILRSGECQRKDGRYQYDYVDLNGQTKAVYSWKLEPTDPLPKGKRQCESLREKEQAIKRDINDGIVPYGGQLTVFQLAEKYILQKTGLRQSTKALHQTVLNIIRKDSFGGRRIDKVKQSDAKEWLIKLQQVDGKSYSTIHSIRGVVRPAFQMAVEDDLIRKNPFEFPLVNVVVDDSLRREALTREQKKKFLEFIKNDSHFNKYYDAIYILFHTGMRISEFCGLTLRDINFKKQTITIDHQLIRTNKMQYIIERPKTEAGTRTIPITDDVLQCFERIIQNRKKPKVEPMIDGHVGFLFLDKNNMPMVALHWEKYLHHICNKYNSIYKVQMPKVTPMFADILTVAIVQAVA